MTFLLIVTVTSMLLAAIMSAIAWRSSGDERRRAEARIAALAAEIHGTPVFTVPRTSAGSRASAVFAGCALVAGAAVALAIVAGRGSSRSPSVATRAAAVTPAPLPLELVALGHERLGDRLTVRGVIRNPSAAGMDGLTAVVFVFAPDGGLLASGRAAVDATALGPGGESTFAVTVPRAADVARYRVSFRTDDRVVPHLDRRHES